MTRYVLRRLILMIPVLIGVSMIVFVTMRVLPGDPVRLHLSGTGATEAQIAEYRRALGLDQPLTIQYTRYVAGLLRGDLGHSIGFRRPVLSLVLERLPATVELGFASLIVALIVGIPSGVLAARYRNSMVDYTITTLATVGVSLPTFWVGLILILVFAVHAQWLPSFGRIDDFIELEAWSGLYLLDSLKSRNWVALKSAMAHLLLPSVALGLSLATFISRLVRSSMLETLAQDYVRTARAKGLPERAVVLAHAFRNALLPVVTVVGMQLGNLLSGAVVAETVFAWPGLGRLAVDAVYQRDFTLAQGVVLVFAVIRLGLNLATDLAYAWIDPRIKYS